MANKFSQLLTANIGGFANRVLIWLAFIASAVLVFLVYTTVKASTPTPVNGAAGGWLILMFVPIWLVLCCWSALCGYRLKGKWRIIGWLPLLLGMLISMLLNNFSTVLVN